jgi:hypothetical protein
MGATLFELMPKDPAIIAAEKEKLLSNKRNEPILIDPLTGFPALSPAGTTSTPIISLVEDEGICKKCIFYTALLAILVVVAYVGYTRYYRKSGMITSYSQVGFNRV